MYTVMYMYITTMCIHVHVLVLLLLLLKEQQPELSSTESNERIVPKLEKKKVNQIHINTVHALYMYCTCSLTIFSMYRNVCLVMALSVRLSR